MDISWPLHYVDVVFRHAVLFFVLQGTVIFSPLCEWTPHVTS